MIDNYGALTLGRYMKVNAILQGEGDELDKQVQIIAILADMTADDILLLPIGDYARMAAQTAFLREHCKPTEIGDGWHLDELRPVTDFRRINTAQYIDFQTFAKGFPASLPQLLSVFLVPEGKAYNDGYDVADVQRRVEDIPFPDALGLAAFFFARFLQLTEDSLTSWGEALRKEKDARKRTEIRTRIAEVQALLQHAGDGSLTWTE
jgi:hypothetical protein